MYSKEVNNNKEEGETIMTEDIKNNKENNTKKEVKPKSTDTKKVSFTNMAKEVMEDLGNMFNTKDKVK